MNGDVSDVRNLKYEGGWGCLRGVHFFWGGYAGTYAGPPYLSAGSASMKAANLAGPGLGSLVVDARIKVVQVTPPKVLP